MGKGNLRFGGKSGILPKPRPIFKRNPIRLPTESELQQEAQAEQGYVEGIPEPVKAGFKFPRAPVSKPVVTVQERIAKTIDEQAAKVANIDTSKLSQDEIWQLKKDEIRRAHLRDAYLIEEKRLARIDELKAKQEAKQREEKALEKVYEESTATKLTLPTIDSYLKGPLVRRRTAEEEEILHEQRVLNRMQADLKYRERKAIDVLDLYHAASQFITTEKELEQAITDAFEVNVDNFDKEMEVEAKLAGRTYAISHQLKNEAIIIDHALGELNGQAGLESIENALDGELEKLRMKAQTASIE